MGTWQDINVTYCLRLVYSALTTHCIHVPAVLAVLHTCTCYPLTRSQAPPCAMKQAWE